jgi:hypothetical protein
MCETSNNPAAVRVWACSARFLAVNQIAIPLPFGEGSRLGGVGAGGRLGDGEGLQA